MSFAMHVEFKSGVNVSITFDNLVEMQAMLRGIEIVNRETPVLFRVWIDGEKKYNE